MKKSNVLDPSAESGTIECQEYGNIDSLEIRYSVTLDFSWSSLGHSTVDMQEFKVEGHVETPKYSGSYQWKEISSKAYKGVFSFFGTKISFTYDFTADIYLDGITMRKNIQCYYSAGMMSLNIQDN